MLSSRHGPPRPGRCPRRQARDLLRDNPAAREVILAIKAHYFDGTKYRDGVTGFAICDAVLNRGQMNVESFAQAWNANLA